MPDVHLVTYATKPLYSYTREYVVDYKKQQAELNQLGLENGFIIHAYDDEWLKSTDFYEKNIKILSEPRGAGYWLWKPYIILTTLETIPENDIVFYLDIDHYFIPNVGDRNFISLIKEHLERDVYDSAREAPSQLFFNNSPTTIKQCRRDAYILTGCDSERYWNAIMIQAGYQCWKNNLDSIKLAKEWLRFCCDKRILTDIPSQLGEEYPEYVDHRHDQTVLSLLVQKYNLRHGHFDIHTWLREREDIEEKFKI